MGYGHASVAEHAVLHIAVENISRLAVETLESNRLASYTEKSTRYQKWDATSFHIPSELENHPLRALYVDTCAQLLNTYQMVLEPVHQVIAAQTPRNPGEKDSAFERRIRSDYIDVCRFLLPAASLANVGVTINARNLEHALRKMLSHPLAEVRQMGAEMKQVAQERLPTLIKHVDPVPYMIQVASELQHLACALPAADRTAPWCRLVSHDEEGENRVLAAALYRFGGFDYTQALDILRASSPAKRAHLADVILGQRERFDIPLRELEYANYTIDLTLDQGGYFELKRHRMMTQTPQRLTTQLGYALPRAILSAGVETPYREAMRAAHNAYTRIAAELPEIASYLVPNGYNRRVLLQLNLRSALHLVNLRTAPGAHFSMRRAAQRIAAEIAAVSPLLGAYQTANPDETWQSIEQAHFAQTAVFPDGSAQV